MLPSQLTSSAKKARESGGLLFCVLDGLHFCKQFVNQIVVGATTNALDDTLCVNDHDRRKSFDVIFFYDFVIVSTEEGSPNQSFFFGGSLDMFQIVTVIETNECERFIF